MIEIIYPDKKPLIQEKDNKEQIFCMIRKRWYLLTPEEWVRQNFLIYLTEVKKYPPSLIAVEKQLLVTGIKKRFDIVVYDQHLNPLIITECKEMNIRLTDEVLQQCLSYYSVIQSLFLLITNGKQTVGFERIAREFFPIEHIPTYKKTG